jgi:hypothetical protein
MRKNCACPAGNLVVKMFTTFESESVCLLYLLTVAFKQVTMFKPATSKEGNSEVYVIGQNMDKSDWLKQFLEDIKPFYGNFPENKSLFDLSAIPADFLEEVNVLASFCNDFTDVMLGEESEQPVPSTARERDREQPVLPQQEGGGPGPEGLGGRTAPGRGALHGAVQHGGGARHLLVVEGAHFKPRV